MYLWNIDALVQDFKAGNVTQKEQFKYMLLCTIAMTLASDPLLHIGSSYNHYDMISTVLVLGLSIVGIFWCYKINTAGDNKDFITRVTCIGLPAIVRVMVILMPIFIALFAFELLILHPETIDEPNSETTPLEIGCVAAAVAIYYWYLSQKIKAVSN